MAKCYIMIGSSEAEKNETAAKISENTGATLISLDTIIKETAVGIPYIQTFNKALETAYQMAKNELKHGRDVVINDANSFNFHPNSLKEYRSQWFAQVKNEKPEMVAIWATSYNKISSEQQRFEKPARDEGWSRIEYIPPGKQTNAGRCSDISWADLEKAVGNKILYVAYAVPSLNFSSPSNYNKVIDAPHVTLSFNPSTSDIKKILNEMPSTTDFKITGYGLDKYNEGFSVSNPYTEKHTKTPHITTGVTPPGKPANTKNLNFVPFTSRSLFGKSIEKIRKLQSSDDVKSVKRPQNVPHLIEGSLAFRMKGREEWINASEVIQQIRNSKSLTEGYSVELRPSKYYQDRSDIMKNQSGSIDTRYKMIENAAANTKTFHFNSHEDFDKWYCNYLKSIPENFQERESIHLSSDDGRLLVDYHIHGSGVTIESSYDGERNPAKDASWDEVLGKHFVSVETLCPDMYDDGPKQSIEQCIKDITQNNIDALCENRNVFICSPDGTEKARCSLTNNNSLRVDFKNAPAEYQLAQEALNKIQAVKAALDQPKEEFVFKTPDLSSIDER